MRVLVLEDDRRIAEGLVAHLGRQGHAVDTAASLAAGWAALCAEPFDLLLLDLGLPDGDGASLLARLRAGGGATLPDPHTPVLVMTARDAVASRIAALDLGADDYVTKPFDPDELAARMRALRRRAAGRGQALLQHADLVLDPAARTLRRAGQVVALSGREFAVLQLLMEASPRVLSRSQIEAGLYNWDGALESNAIEVHVHHLRKKLGDGLIRTMRGVGYCIPEAAPASGPGAGPLPSRPAIPAGAEPGRGLPGGQSSPGEGLGPEAQRGLQGRPAYPPDEGPH